ncbi:hypothetical protein [Lentzea sp. NPDC004782]|uniref:hypothetical protein n=1 Tax=Lentzea sp. NPDC004782 TaxID=3154458 RepID=UPI0033A1A616
MSATTYRDPRPVAASLKQPEVNSASLNDVLADQGWGVQAVNWVFEAVTGESLVATIITPITGDWTKIRADGDAWRMVGNAMNDVSYNLTDAVGKVRAHWDGDAARAHEKYIALGWKAALFAEMGVTQLIAKGFDTVASGAEALGKQAARLLDYLVNKLLEAAATVWIPLAGWIKAAEMVWNAYQIYRRVMDIIDTVHKLIADVKSLFDAVGRVFSAIGKLKDANSLAEAMNATQEVAEAGRDVRNSVNDIRDDMTSIKDSATEIADRGHDIGSKVREVYTPPGTADETKPAAVTSVAPGGAPVSAPPVVHGADAPATHAAAATGPAVSAPPTLGSGSGSGGSGAVPAAVHGSSGGVPGVPSGGHGSPAATPHVDTTHAASAATATAPPSHQSTPVVGGMPMGAPPMAGGGGDSTRSSGSRPGSSAGSAWPTGSSSTPSGQAKPSAGGLPSPPGHGGAGSGLPTPPGHANTPSGAGGSRPGGSGLPTPPSGSGAAGAHATPGSAGTHPTSGSGGTHPAPGSTGTHPAPGSGNGLPTPPNSGSHPAPGGSGNGLPTPPGHPSAGSGTATAPAPHSGGGLPSPPGHPGPSTGGGLPSPPGHPSPSAGPDHTTSNGSGGTPHDPSTSHPHDPKPHDTTPHDGGHHDTDGKDHDTNPSDAKHHEDHPDPTPAGHDVDPKHDQPNHDAHTNHETQSGHETHDGHDGGQGGDDTPRSPKGHDLTPAFDHAAMAASGEGYHHQLEQIYPNQADRDRYVELSKRLSTDLSPSEAQEVAHVRNQIKVESGDLVTKVLHQNAVDGYLKQHDDPTTDAARRQGMVAGSIARAEDVHDINKPMALREGLALDDKGEGWTPIKDKAESAMQLRYHLTDDQAAKAAIPFGGPEKSDRDFSRPPTPGQEHREYQSPQEKAHYDASAKQMADAGGAAEPKRGRDPFTGTGYTGGGVPEWVAKPADLPDRAEIWEVRDGKERLHAVYEKGLGWYQLKEDEASWSSTPVK